MGNKQRRHTWAMACGLLAGVACLLGTTSCDDEKDVVVPDNWVTLDQTSFTCEYKVDTLRAGFALASGLDASVPYVVNKTDWCSGWVEGDEIVIAVAASRLLEKREAKMFLTYDEAHSMELTLTQGSAPVVKITNFDTEAVPTSVGLYGKLDLNAAIKPIPEDASYQEFKYVMNEGTEGATISEDGYFTASAAGTYTFKVVSPDEGAFSKELTITVNGIDFERSGWTVTATSANCTDGENTFNYLPDTDGVNGAPELMLDGDVSTFFSMLKPGKKLGDYTDTNKEMWFTLDLGVEATFNQFYWRHRNITSTLQAQEIALFASEDGETWKQVGENITLETGVTEVGYVDCPETTTRYLKVQYTKWNTASSASVQVAEFNLAKADK